MSCCIRLIVTAFLALGATFVHAQQTIAFSPAAPASGESIAIVFTEPFDCAAQPPKLTQQASNSLTFETLQPPAGSIINCGFIPFPPPATTTLTVKLATLPPGTYAVTWNTYQSQSSGAPTLVSSATATLVVVAAPPLGTGANGVWYDPAYTGSGFNFLMSNAGLIVTYYGWDATHNRLWLTSDLGPVTITPGLPFTLNMNQTAGGSFATPAPPSTNSVWGTVMLNFTSCTAAKATLSGKDGTVDLNLRQLARPSGLPPDC
jgi:hypothetical protein